MKPSSGLPPVIFAVLLAVAGTIGIDSEFRPFDANVDLSHEPDVSRLSPDWEVVPVPKWPGVFEVYDRNGSGDVPVPLPKKGSYQMRLKVLFRDPQARLSYAVNGTPSGQWSPGKVGHAEKRSFILSPDQIRKGENVISFKREGPPRSILYEQVRIRNYTSKIMAGHLYLAPGKSTAHPFPWMPWCIVFGIALAGERLWRLLGERIGGLTAAQALGWTQISWWTGILGLTGLCVTSLATPYHLEATSTGFVLLSAVLLGLGLIPILLILIGSLLKYLAIALARSKGHITLFRAVKILLAAAGKLLAGLIRTLFKTLFNGLSWLARWFWTHQHAAGYLQMAAVLFGISILITLFKWTPAAVGFGHASGVALVISMLLRALDALREDPNLS
ncbi:MAG: hypothetical protein HY594_04225 [Candidatus Omnitrophica bacterium]|nr:hypothetical protein [Candidatus Omnitrophota bacterium]